MTEGLDTGWFDLKNYEKLNDLDLAGWHRQLVIRSFVNYVIFSDENAAILEKSNIKTILHWIEKIKVNPIIDSYEYEWGSWREKKLNYPFNTFSVYASPAAYSWYDTNDDRLADIWECCKLSNTYEATVEQETLIHTPIDLLFKERGVDCAGLTHLSIDLTATDEQIISDFQFWLTEYRKAINYQSNKNNFTDKNFYQWVQWRLLPYVDLKFVAALEEKELTYAMAARIIFADEYQVDIVDRLRRTTKPKAEWLMRFETLQAIEAQLHVTA